MSGNQANTVPVVDTSGVDTTDTTQLKHNKKAPPFFVFLQAHCLFMLFWHINFLWIFTIPDLKILKH